VNVHESRVADDCTGVSGVNWLATQHDSRRDGDSRSSGGRIARQTAGTMRGVEPLFVASGCAAKLIGLEGLSRGSPG